MNAQFQRPIDGPKREGASCSLWMDTAEAAPVVPLRHDTDTQVCIVGAGIAGLSTAYQLARTGKQVVVVDERAIGHGQSARTTGHLCSALDDRYFELAKLHGDNGAHLAARTHTVAIDAIESICEFEQIDCDFARVDGYLVQGKGDLHAGVLDREYEAAQRAGLAVERVPGAPGALSVFGDALRFPRQARFHSLRYLNGLAEVVQKLGGQVYTGNRVAVVHGGKEAHVLLENGMRVAAESIVVATHVPFNDRVAIHTKQAAYRTYVIALRLRDTVPDALLWDTLDPYHYVRTAIEDNTSWLLVGGEDCKSGQDDAPLARYAALEQWARHYFPMAGEIGYRWSGHIIEPVDSLAFIGLNPGLDDNVYIVTGDSGNGLTHGTIAGLLLAELITRGESLWRELYSPGRINPRAVDQYLKENLNVAAQYRERVTGGEAETTAALAPGEAAVLRDGLHKIAAYRDPNGALHLHSALCPHLGCVVHWNAAECSWDCPCHGSRFDGRDGHVLNGPADRGLSEAHGVEPLRLPHRDSVQPHPPVRM